MAWSASTISSLTVLPSNGHRVTPMLADTDTLPLESRQGLHTRSTIFCAIAHRSSSPAACPRVSFTRLNPSRSINSSAPVSLRVQSRPARLPSPWPGFAPRQTLRRVCDDGLRSGQASGFRGASVDLFGRVAENSLGRLLKIMMRCAASVPGLERVGIGLVDCFPVLRVNDVEKRLIGGAELRPVDFENAEDFVDQISLLLTKLIMLAFLCCNAFATGLLSAVERRYENWQRPVC